MTLSTLIQSLMGPKNTICRRVRRMRLRPRPRPFESLEERKVLTCGVSYDADTLTVAIEGSSGADSASVEWLTQGTSHRLDDQLRVVLSGGCNATRTFSYSQVNKLTFEGLAGADNFTNRSNIGSVADGGLGSDTLQGGDGADTLKGGGGQDWLFGGGGNDTLDGGVGGVAVYADNTGDDFLYGGSGDDILNASDYGNNSLNGDSGDDVLYGWQGNDRLFGGIGDDRLHGFIGSDYLAGGNGNDVYVFTAESKGDVDIVVEHSGGGTDTLDFSAFGTGSSVTVNLASDSALVSLPNRAVKTGALGQAGYLENVIGGSGSDTIRGNAAGNLLQGGGGSDSIWGNAGNDQIFGDAGSDRLYAGTGSDTLHGGTGNDVFVSIDGDASDTLFGDAGADSFWVDRENTFFTDTVHDATEFESATNLHRVGRFANGADKSLNGDNIADPTDSRAVRDFSNHPLFASTGPSERDINQGRLSDCWLMAGLGAAARANPNAIRQTVVELGDRTYAVELGGNYYRVDADLPVSSSSSESIRFAGLGEQSSIWVPIIEKAYAHFRRNADTFASLNNGSASTVFKALGASGLVTKSFTDGGLALAHIASELAQGKAVAVSIDVPPRDVPLIGDHAYIAERVIYTTLTILGRTVQRPVSVVLRNPWGIDGAGNDGTNDGRVTITADQLISSSDGIQSAWV